MRDMSSFEKSGPSDLWSMYILVPSSNVKLHAIKFYNHDNVENGGDEK